MRVCDVKNDEWRMTWQCQYKWRKLQIFRIFSVVNLSFDIRTRTIKPIFLNYFDDTHLLILICLFLCLFFSLFHIMLLLVFRHWADNFVVAWKRGIAILSAGTVKVTPDPRVHLVNGYSLQITKAVPQDAGDYVCQIATMEPREITHTVEILGKYKVYCIV